ncbi:MAG: nucleotidyltransferase family protein [Candidatus Omnitrophota bacterium]|jgi:NDP-sugar pyrophosphorylase family protein|nr:MAG: nucleotidyltransferase family protein [Candidatus Omnitrophota bacterium]
MKSVILAAGKGTRMKHLTKDQPKPMVDIGKERILERIINTIRDTGIHEFVVVTGYFANLIENHWGNGEDFGIHIEYVRQPVLDGTAGALRLTRDAVGEEPFFMTFGDIITSLENYSNIVEDYRRNPASVILGVNKVEDPCKGAAVFFDETTRRVEKIIEKPPKGTSLSNWNNSGLFVFEPSIFPYLDKVELSPRGEYELPDAIRMAIEDHLPVRAMILGGFWGDIGTPEDVDRLRQLIQENIHVLDDTSRTMNLDEI